MNITLKNISLGYKNRPLLTEVNTTFCSNSLTALLGRNGTGKSTLLRTLSGLNQPLTGSILLDNTDISTIKSEQIAKKISFVTTEKVRIANLSCEELVSLGRVPYTNWIGRIEKHDKEMITKSLELVGMLDFASKPMNKISDGECQRVMIARALAQDTPIILLDEPTAFLDLPNKYEICNLLKKLAKQEGKTIILSTHDLDIAKQSADYLAIIDNQKIILDKSTELDHDLERIFKIKG